jgi:uncharacterized membrane protein
MFPHFSKLVNMSVMSVAGLYCWQTPLVQSLPISSYLNNQSINITELPIILSPSEITQIAEEITVRIIASSPASGVLVERNDNIYYVLTVKHAITFNPGEEASLMTHDGQIYPIDTYQVRYFPGDLDLAIVQFTSNRDYPLAKIGNSDLITELNTVYVGGFPEVELAITEPTFQITEGKITGKGNYRDGYGLVYTNLTKIGMSGGGILNKNGELVGIHGLAERYYDGNNRLLEDGFHLGIPINRYVSQLDYIRLASDDIEISLTPTPSDEIAEFQCQNAVVEAIAKIKQGRNVNINLTNIALNEIYRDYPSHYQEGYQFILNGPAAPSILNSPQFLKTISNNLLTQCQSVGVINFHNPSRYQNVSFGLKNNKIAKFECAYSPNKLTNLTWDVYPCRIPEIIYCVFTEPFYNFEINTREKALIIDGMDGNYKTYYSTYSQNFNQEKKEAGYYIFFPDTDYYFSDQYLVIDFNSEGRDQMSERFYPTLGKRYSKKLTMDVYHVGGCYNQKIS